MRECAIPNVGAYSMSPLSDGSKPRPTTCAAGTNYDELPEKHIEMYTFFAIIFLCLIRQDFLNRKEKIMVVLIIIASLLALWIDYLIAKQFYLAAKEKGHPQKKYLWICFFLGVIGYLLVVALPDRAGIQKVTYDDLPSL